MPVHAPMLQSMQNSITNWKKNWLFKTTLKWGKGGKTILLDKKKMLKYTLVQKEVTVHYAEVLLMIYHQIFWTGFKYKQKLVH